MVVVRGSTLKALREKMGLSRKECCRQAGITENTLRRLESGENAQAMPQTVKAIANVLGVEATLLGAVKKRSSEVVTASALGGSLQAGA